MVISDFAIKRPMITVVTMVALVVFGLFALWRLQVDEFPDIQQPVVLTRGGDEIRLRGNGATVKSGTDVKVKSERPEFSLSLSEMELGSSVVFQLPGFAKADSAKPQDSLDALRKASESSYFKDKDSLWVKVVVATPPAVPAMPLQQQASVRVSR